MYLEFDLDLVHKFIEAGYLTMEEFIDLKQWWSDEMGKLREQYPPEKVKEILLAEQRRRCEWCLNKIKALELENRDARTRGVPYSKRNHYSRQIEILRKMFEDNKQKGLWYKRNNSSSDLLTWVKPLDLERVRRVGLESFLKYATI